MIEMGQAFLGTKLDVILKIILPAASPIIFAGLRLGVSAGFIGAILAELKITPTGVGDIITYSLTTNSLRGDTSGARTMSGQVWHL